MNYICEYFMTDHLAGKEFVVLQINEITYAIKPLKKLQIQQNIYPGRLTGIDSNLIYTLSYQDQSCYKKMILNLSFS